ncbi:uncharacterized protein MAM_07278 [Metarhizium album ARSEF 1941]|uniref:Uncharacterized protein n=1 Tax=Metarhizium album (strain ARSEF 1941) TaxID=1081103 RepID=A0A0B2WMF9_METAS|nr:uncharacterized protein MAM_07278 [Metarhizium album ARSEF 1941]KHN94859.1 hypothetical protein MAM_07278 [Metarhizium album ARSEF 1941]
MASVDAAGRERFDAAEIMVQEMDAQTVEVLELSRVSSQEVQGVRSTGLNYSMGVSRKYPGRSSMASPVLASPPLYTPSMMSSVGHDSLGDQGDMAYGCGPKQYQQVHEWTNGYGDDQSMDFETTHQGPPGHDHPYMMGQYRPATNSMVVRANGMVYMDTCGGYGYGNASGRHASAGDVGYSFDSAIPCYPESTAGNGEKVVPLSSSRSRPGSVSAMGRRTSAVSSAAEHSGLMDISGSNYHGYDGGVLASYHGGSMDRGADMYTTAPPVDEFGQAASLRSHLSGYPYRYTDTTSEGGTVAALDDQQYLVQGRGPYLGSISPTENDPIHCRGNASAGLHS